MKKIIEEKATKTSREYHESLRTITVDDVKHIKTEDAWEEFVYQKSFVEEPDIFSHKDQADAARSHVCGKLNDDAQELINNRIG